MNLLAIVQSLHREAKLPGTAPASVAGLSTSSSRSGDLVRWAIEAYHDIQRERDGKWKWLRRKFNFNTVASTASYAYSAVTDTAASAVVSRFKRWDVADDRDPTYIYLVADGQATQREIFFTPWTGFRSSYVRATHEESYPATLSVDTAGTLYLGPTPDAIYRLDGHYWRSNQALVDDDDEPEMPADYHMLIVYRALTKYGYNSISADVLARCKYEGTALYNALVEDQSYSRFSLTVAGALA